MPDHIVRIFVVSIRSTWWLLDLDRVCGGERAHFTLNLVSLALHLIHAKTTYVPDTVHFCFSGRLAQHLIQVE